MNANTKCYKFSKIKIHPTKGTAISSFLHIFTPREIFRNNFTSVPFLLKTDENMTYHKTCMQLNSINILQFEKYSHISTTTVSII